MNTEMNLIGHHPHKLKSTRLEFFLVQRGPAETKYETEAAEVHAQTQYDLLLAAVTKRMKRRKMTGWSLDKLPPGDWVYGRNTSGYMGLRYEGDAFYSALFVSPAVYADSKIKWFVVVPTTPAEAHLFYKKAIGRGQLGPSEFTKLTKASSSVEAVAKLAADALRLTDELVLRAMYSDLRSLQQTMAKYTESKIRDLQYNTVSKLNNTAATLRPAFFEYIETCIRGTPPEAVSVELAAFMGEYTKELNKIRGMQTDADLCKSIAFLKLTNDSSVYAIDVSGPHGGRCVRLPESYPIPVEIMQRVATVQINENNKDLDYSFMRSLNMPGVGAKLIMKWTQGSGALVLANEQDYNAVFA